MLYVPLSLELEILPDLSRLVSKYILKLLFLLSKHLDLTLVVLDVVIHATDHILNTKGWLEPAFNDYIKPTSSWFNFVLRLLDAAIELF